jgi:hypothetical protein
MGKGTPKVGRTSVRGAGGGALDPTLLEQSRVALGGAREQAEWLSNFVRREILEPTFDIRGAAADVAPGLIRARGEGAERMAGIQPLGLTAPLLDTGEIFGPRFEEANQRKARALQELAERSTGKGGRQEALRALIDTEHNKLLTGASIAADKAEADAVYNQKILQNQYRQQDQAVQFQVASALTGVPLDVASLVTQAPQMAQSAFQFETGVGLQTAAQLASLYGGQLQAQTQLDVTQSGIDAQRSGMQAQQEMAKQQKTTDALISGAAIATMGLTAPGTPPTPGAAGAGKGVTMSPMDFIGSTGQSFPGWPAPPL